MSYRIYNGTQLLGDVNNKSTGINGLLPATSYQLGVTNYNGSHESSKTTINVKTRGIRLIIPTSLTVNSTITLHYQEYSLGLVPIGTEPAGMFGGGNKRDIQAKVISVDNGKSTVELLEPLESSSTVSIGGINLAKNTSNKLVNVIASPWFFVGSASSKTFNNLPDYQGKYMTVRVWIENPSEDSRVQIWTNKQTIFGNTIKAGQSGYSTASGIIPTGFVDWNLPVGNNSSNKITFGWKEFKIELGEVATPWSPAPEDTQYIVDNAQMNRLQDGSFAAFNGYRAIYFRK
ncbi:hypothetical protein FYL05_08285 [Lactobacillus salivarius]|uniref:hypothetical protein n=1 Tax=Ligilactobacillus salivarius TaxID=1624 RepID=UPI00136F511F|nr:hypothetical protein [Ligilactobacillus salivarius]MYY46050.1 hypothetical protein [Ligilactobacillus salivarius]MYY91495.1 hypothetical protein [Ligilactobacillus salivarius]